MAVPARANMEPFDSSECVPRRQSEILDRMRDNEVSKTYVVAIPAALSDASRCLPGGTTSALKGL